MFTIRAEFDHVGQCPDGNSRDEVAISIEKHSLSGGLFVGIFNRNRDNPIHDRNAVGTLAPRRKSDGTDLGQFIRVRHVKNINRLVGTIDHENTLCFRVEGRNFSRTFVKHSCPIFAHRDNREWMCTNIGVPIGHHDTVTGGPGTGTQQYGNGGSCQK